MKKRLSFLAMIAVFLSAFSMEIHATGEVISYTELDYDTKIEHGKTTVGELNTQSTLTNELGYAVGYNLTMTEGKSYRITLEKAEQESSDYCWFYIFTDGELTGGYNEDILTSDVFTANNVVYFTPGHSGNYHIAVAQGQIEGNNSVRYSVTVEEINKIVYYTELDYSTKIEHGKTTVGELNTQSTQLNLNSSWNNRETECYAAGYILTMNEGKSYRINLMSSQKNSEDYCRFHILTDAEFNGNFYIDELFARQISFDSYTLYYTPDHTGDYRLIFRNAEKTIDENNPILYSINIEEIDKIEHYKEITLPFETDTVFDGEKANDGYYGWKLTFDEPTTLMAYCNGYLYIHKDSPDSESISADSHNYGTQKNIWHLDAGVYYVKCSSWTGNLLHVSIDGGATGTPMLINSLPYTSDVLPSTNKCYGDDGNYYYAWEVSEPESGLINYEITADGETILSNHGMPVEVPGTHTLLYVPAQEYKTFEINITEASAVSYTKMTLEEYLNSITETTDITKPISGKLDAASVMVSGLLNNSEVPAQAYRFNIESNYTVLQIKNLDNDFQNQTAEELTIYRKIGESTYNIVQRVSYNDYKGFISCEAAGEYYLVVTTAFDHSCMGNFSVETEVTVVPETTHAAVYADAITPELPGIVSGKIDLQTPIISEEGFFQYCRAKAYRFDFSTLPASSAADINIFRDYASRIFFVKKEADGKYTVLQSSDDENVRFVATEAAEYYVMIYAYGTTYNFEYNYRISTSIYSHTKIEDILKAITTTTDCNTTITGIIDENTTLCGNIFGYKGHVVAYKFNIPELENGDYVLSFRNMQMTDNAYYRWMYTIAYFDQESGDLYRYDPTEVNGGSMSYSLSPAGDYYFILFEQDDRFGEYSIDVDIKEMSRPSDTQNAMSIEELLSEITTDSPLPINIEKRPIDQHVVAGDGVFGTSENNYYADAVRFTLTAATEINYTFYGSYINTNLYIYSYNTESGIYTLRNKFNNHVCETETFDAGTYYFVAVDGNDFNLNDYTLKISEASAVPTLEERMLAVETVQTIPSNMEGYLETRNEEKKTYHNGNMITADIYRFDLKEGDVISISNEDYYYVGSWMLYYYDEETKTFDNVYFGNGNLDITRSGRYFFVFYDRYYYAQQSKYHCVVDVPVEQQQIIEIKANPEIITVDDTDNDIAIQLVLTTQVNIIATTERDLTISLPHSATDWVISQDRTYATYTVDTDEFNLADNVEKEVKVLINPTMVTITASAGENGNISPSGEFRIAKGFDQEFYIQADDGFVVNEIKINGTVEKTGCEGYRYTFYTLTAIDKNTTLEVSFIKEVFKPIETYTVTVIPNDEKFGTVTISGDSPDKTGRYYNGAKLMLTAVANEGYIFSRWSDDKTNPVRELTVVEDVNLTAIFVKDVVYYTVIIEANHDERGYIEISGAEPLDKNKYAEGSVLTVKAIANSGWKFTEWSDEVETAERKITVTKVINLTAIFTKRTDVELVSEDGFAVYSHDKTIYIESENTSDDITVADISGRIVYTGKARMIAVESEGIYIVMMNNTARKVAVK